MSEEYNENVDTQGELTAEQSEEISLSPQEEESEKQVVTTIEDLVTEVASLNLRIEARLQYDTAKEEAFERLYTELEGLRQDAAFNQIRPLYMDLILLYDRIESIRQDITQSTSSSAPSSDTLQTISDELLEILSRREIEVIHTADSAFNPSVQLAIGTQPTSSEDENNQVDRLVRQGFGYQGRVLRAEEVIIKKYVPDNISPSITGEQSEEEGKSEVQEVVENE